VDRGGPKILWLLLAWLCLPGTAEAARYALFVGSNRAPAGLEELRYAHSDARKMQAVFLEFGGLDPTRTELLLDPGGAELEAAIERLRAQAGPDAQLFFYYSGHASDEALLLGQEELPIPLLRTFLEDEEAQVRLAILDACQSGAASRTKGGQHRPAVDIRWDVQLGVEGAVLITSSTAEEASVERDDIGGSLFSHFLASGLRGAADADQNGKVSLEEAFSYSYDRTLVRSSESRSGVQHPTFEYRITGQRQLELTWLEQSSSLRFGEDLAGSYLVFDRKRGQVVAELAKLPEEERRLWLPEGDYYIKKRLPSAVLIQKVRLEGGTEHRVTDQGMHTVPFEEDVTKGRLSETFQPTWKYGAPYTRNTAYTLRRGERIVGLNEAAVGLSDEATLSTRTLGALMLGPAVSGKFRMAQGEQLTWSLESGFEQSNLNLLFYGSDRSYIHLRSGTSLTWQPSPQVTLTGTARWELQSAPRYYKEEEGGTKNGTTPEVQTLLAGTSLGWLLGEQSLVQLNAEGAYPMTGSESYLYTLLPAVQLLYARSHDRLRYAVGVRYSHDVSLWDYSLDTEVAVEPVLDLWWRW
jgi:hypothetical protein